MPEISYTLGADNSTLVRAMEQAHASVQQSMSAMQSAVAGAATGMRSAIGKITGALGALGISFAAFRGLEGIVSGIEHVAETGKELGAMSAATGASIKDLIGLRKAFKEAGIEANAVQGSLVRMQSALGGTNEAGQSTDHVFTKLKLSVSELRGKGVVEQFEAITKAIGKLDNESLRTNAYRDLFGKEGAELKALGPDAVKEAIISSAAIGDVYQRNSENFKHLANTMEALRGRVSGFFVGFTDQITPVILPMLDKLKAAMNFVSVGEKVGEVFRVIAAGFAEGGLGELVGLALQKAAMEFVNTLYGAAGALGTILLAAVKPFANNFSTTVVAFGDMLTGAVESMGVVLLEVFEKPIVALQAGIEYAMQTTMEKLGKMPVLGDMLGLSGVHAQSYGDIYNERKAAGANLAGFNSNELAEDSVKHFSRGKEALAGLGSQVEMKKAMAEAMATFRGAMNGSGPFDVAKVTRDFEAVLNRLKESADKLMPKGNAQADQKQPNDATASMTSPVGKVDTISDRLSKIGLFIGGAGGPSGEKAAMDTAKNTEATAKHVAGIVPVLQDAIQTIGFRLGRF